MKQNVFKKVLPYKMRNAAMALAATVAGMTTTSCEKDDIEPEIIPTEVYNYNIYANNLIGMRAEAVGGVKDDSEIVRDMDFLKQLAKDPTTKEINIITVGSYGIWESHDLKDFREYIETRKNISPKIKGKGEIDTNPGVASQVPADSAALAGFGYIVGYHAR